MSCSSLHNDALYEKKEGGGKLLQNQTNRNISGNNKRTLHIHLQDLCKHGP